MSKQIINKLLDSGLSIEAIKILFKDYYLGQFPSIDFSNNSPNLFILDAHTTGAKAVNDKFIEVKNNLDPETAEGLFLRKIGFITAGTLPINASRTLVKTYIEGEKGSHLKRGFEIRNANQQKFFLKSDVFITNERVLEVELKGDETSSNYSFIIDFEGRRKKLEAVGQDFLLQFRDKINYDPELNAFCVANIREESLIITATLDKISIFLIEGLKYEKIKASGDFEAEFEGKIDFGGSEISCDKPAGIKDIQIMQVIIGTEEESDAEFKERTNTVIENLGSVQNKLAFSIKKENPSINYIRILENDRKEESEEGLPANSIECIVDGGESYNLAKSIWNFKGGVSTFGNVDVLIQDEWDKTHKVSYSRPELVQTSLAITLLSTKNIDKTDAEKSVKLLVMKFALKNNKIGTDFSLGRLSAYITDNFTSVENTETEATTSKTEQQVVPWKTNLNIKVKYKEVLVFDENRIKVSIKIV